MNFWEEIENKSTTGSNPAYIYDKNNEDKFEEKEILKNISLASSDKTNDIAVEKSSIADTELDSVDVVIITAVETEYKLACEIFGNKSSPFFFDGFKYSTVFFEVNEEKIIKIAILKQKNIGLISAAIAATYSIKTLNPKLLLMCGVCAGIENRVKLGDIIVFSPVFDYGAGKYNNGMFLPDYRQRTLNGEIKQIVDRMSVDIELCRKIKDSWRVDIGKPSTELQIHIEPCGAGAAVITDETVSEQIRNHQRTLIGIDMESFAIAEAAYETSIKEVPWLVVKGVQDFANPFKNDNYREYAAHISAVFLKEFLYEYFNN